MWRFDFLMLRLQQIPTFFFGEESSARFAQRAASFQWS
jgi:hypothetical protein